MSKSLATINEAQHLEITREVGLGEMLRGITLIIIGLTTVISVGVACASSSAEVGLTPTIADGSNGRPNTMSSITPTAAQANSTPATVTRTPSPTSEPPQAYSSTATAKSKVELRSGPGGLYDIKKIIPPDETVIVMAKTRDGDWYMIRTSDGSDGWAKADIIELNGAASAIPVAQVPPTVSPLAPTDVPKSNPTSAAPAAASLKATAIGDSIMLGAATDLRNAIGNVDIDAAVGRQVATAIDILRTRKNNGQLAPIVIIDIGNNGPVSAKQFDDLMSPVVTAKRVVFVNLKVPRDWETPNNAILAEGVKRYPNATLVNWYDASASHPELFWDDGLHLRPEGARLYANLVAAAVKAP